MLGINKLQSNQNQKSLEHLKLKTTEVDGCDDYDPNDLDNQKLFINRELSLLEFNQRVLEQIEDFDYPLFERIRFLAIVGKNLDEFFMVRLAIILQRMNTSQKDFTSGELSATQLFFLIQEKVQYFLLRLSDCWKNILQPLLAQENIFFVNRENYNDDIRNFLSQYFQQHIYAALTPLALDRTHSFPHISNLSLNLAAVVEHENDTRFARIKIPSTFPRFVKLPHEYSTKPGDTFVFVEDIIEDNIQTLFRDVKVVEVHLFRVIHDTHLKIEESDFDNIREKIDQKLKQIPYHTVNLLEVQESMPQYLLDILIENFHVTEEIIPKTMKRMGFRDWSQLLEIPEPHLKFPQHRVKDVFEPFSNEKLLDQIKAQDYLMHHPYSSFDSIVRFIKASVEDPYVLAIKITLYRVEENSIIVEQLVKASQQGKQVSVIVELQARFDEYNNVNWAKKMEVQGIHVSYGLLSFKTHCKLCMVVRQEEKGAQCYTHISTGNYNQVTANLYTDMGLFTANPNITKDVIEVFNLLTGYSQPQKFNHLLVAPHNLRSELRKKIEREIKQVHAGKPAHLIFQINALEDKEIMKALIKGSQAGVKIDLIVRGICCLRPNIPGISDNIRVISIIGRFLEHARVYYFLNGGNEEILIGSADLMKRNLDSRIEILCPILDPVHRKHIRQMLLNIFLKDNQRAYLLKTDGRYIKKRPSKEDKQIDTHKALLKLYAKPN